MALLVNSGSSPPLEQGDNSSLFKNYVTTFQVADQLGCSESYIVAIVGRNRSVPGLTLTKFGGQNYIPASKLDVITELVIVSQDVSRIKRQKRDAIARDVTIIQAGILTELIKAYPGVYNKCLGEAKSSLFNKLNSPAEAFEKLKAINLKAEDLQEGGAAND